MVFEPQPLNSLYHKYRRCVVWIIVTSEQGDEKPGSGFHIGQGYIVTARHVVEGGNYEVWGHASDQALQVKKVITPADTNLDVAVLETNFSLREYVYGSMDARYLNIVRVGRIPISWVPDSQAAEKLVMSEVLILGYPPVPRAHPTLVAVHGHVNAVVRKYTDPGYPHFVVSVTPRGGFSGGPVISERDFLLGVFTEALYRDGEPFELGFAAALSVQPICEVLRENDINLTNPLAD